MSLPVLATRGTQILVEFHLFLWYSLSREGARVVCGCVRRLIRVYGQNFKIGWFSANYKKALSMGVAPSHCLLPFPRPGKKLYKERHQCGGRT